MRDGMVRIQSTGSRHQHIQNCRGAAYLNMTYFNPIFRKVIRIYLDINQLCFIFLRLHFYLSNKSSFSGNVLHPDLLE